MYTLILTMILVTGSVAVEDVGIYATKERCEAVATELQEKLARRGAGIVLICVPTDEQTEA